MLKIRLLILSTVLSLSASSRVTNYSSTNNINDIILNGDKLIVLTGGGLCVHDLNSNSISLKYGSTEYPDPDLTAATFDKNQQLWVGSKFGYLAQLNSKWDNLSTTYQSAGWKIRALYPYGDFLFVGAAQGLSLFDINKKRADKSAVAFNTLTTTQVNTMIVFGDALYVGLDNGVVRLDSISTNLKGYNFFYPLIWKIDTRFTDTVTSFTAIDGILKAYKGPARQYKGKMLVAEGRKLLHDGIIIAEVPSPVTCLTVVGNDCWIGTERDYYYKWDGSTLKNFSIPGPVFTSVNACVIDKSQHLWVIPKGNMKDDFWWSGFHEFDGENWIFHNTKKYPGMGPMPSNVESQGLTVSRDGAVWISTAGAHTKRYVPSTQNWSQFCTYSHRGSGGMFYHSTPCPDEEWAKTDAIAQDSSGFIWIGCWENPDGSLICYDPRFEPVPEKNGTPEAHYRRFFPDGNSNYSANVTSITVEHSGRILVGTDGPTKLVVLKHTGNPVANGVEIEKTFDATGQITDVASSTSGETYLITASDGACKYVPGSTKLEKIGAIGSGIKAVEIEDEDHVWFASPREGLIRYNVKTEDKTVFNQINGLVSLDVEDLAIDKENGFMWAATDVGVSRISLGITSSSSGTTKISVFPIPFRKSRNTSINFHNVPNESKVSIYSIQGQLIAQAPLVISNATNSYHTWVVPESIVPGTYYYAVDGKEQVKNGKLLIVP